MVRRLLLSACLVLVVGIVAACQTEPNLRDEGYLNDDSLITGEPCEAPCWRNITPGETRWRDALVLLEDDQQLNNVEEITDDASDARIINFNDGDGPQCCRVYTDDGRTVSDIITLLAPDIITLGQLIEKYGEPAYVTGGDVTPEQTLLSLVYPDVPLIIYIFAPGTVEGEIAANSEVIGAIYTTETRMAELLQSTNLYNWEGYVKLSDYLDEEFDIRADDNAETDGDTSANDETANADETTED